MIRETMMAKRSLVTMSIDALIQLRDEVGKALSERAGDIQRQLAQLGGGRAGTGAKRGRPPGGSLKGRRVAPKYRGPNGETWAGRGMRPRWMQDAMKRGKKPEDFLIGGHKVAVARKGSAAKKSRKRKA
jgi:DNA-binding protein H-NS